MNQRWLGSVECIAVQKKSARMFALLVASSTEQPELGHFNAGKPECGQATRERHLARDHQCRLPTISCSSLMC